jgi:hypothetical protein
MGRKIFTIAVIWGLFTVGEGYGLLEFGVRGGYRTGNLALKEGTMTIIPPGDTGRAEFKIAKDSKPLSGLGIELLGRFSPPALPITIEGGIGVNNTAINIEKTDTTTDTTTVHYWTVQGKYKASAINLFTFCSYKFPVKGVTPYVGVGPYLGIVGYTYQIEDKTLSGIMNVKVTSKRSLCFGFRGGAGVNVNLIPKIGVNVGIVYDYYLGTKGDEVWTFSLLGVTATSHCKTKYSHSELGILIGVSYTMM